MVKGLGGEAEERDSQEDSGWRGSSHPSPRVLSIRETPGWTGIDGKESRMKIERQQVVQVGRRMQRGGT